MGSGGLGLEAQFCMKRNSHAALMRRTDAGERTHVLPMEKYKQNLISQKFRIQPLSHILLGDKLCLVLDSGVAGTSYLAVTWYTASMSENTC